MKLLLALLDSIFAVPFLSLNLDIENCQNDVTINKIPETNFETCYESPEQIAKPVYMFGQEYSLDLTRECCENFSSIPSKSTWTSLILNFEFEVLQMDLTNKCCEIPAIPSNKAATSLDLTFDFDSINLDIEKPCCESSMIPSNKAATTLALILNFNSINLDIEKPCCESVIIPSKNQSSVSTIIFS